MKKTVLFAMALAASAATAPAAPLDSKGIPADAEGIIHIDLDLCAKTAIGAAIKQFSEKNLVEKNSGKENYERFKKQTGIDPEKDISSVTVGLFKPANGSSAPSAVAVVRGAFSPGKIIAAAKENNCTATTRGALTLIDLSGLASASPRTPGDDPEDDESDEPAKAQAVFAGIVDKNTILLAETADIVEKAAATFSGNAGSYAPPATLDTFGKQEGASLILAYFGGGLAKGGDASMPMTKAENILVALCEKGANLRARVYSEYSSPEAARKTQAAVQMLIGLMQMGAANSQSPEAEARIQNVQRLIDSLKMNLVGKSLDITADYPVAGLIEEMKKYNGGE